MFPPVDFAIGGWLLLIMLPLLALVAWCVILLVIAVPLWAAHFLLAAGLRLSEIARG